MLGEKGRTAVTRARGREVQEKSLDIEKEHGITEI